MKAFSAVCLAGALLLGASGQAPGKVKVTKVFLLENSSSHQWCAYTNESAWNKAVQDAGTMTVATLNYTGGHLSQIDVTSTDESGDWAVYDNYFLDGRQEIVRLSRTINVLPGDRSLLQTFAIHDGKATMTEATAKQLSTGQTLTSPKAVWLPDLPITTQTRRLPFSSLLGRASLRTASKTCAPMTGRR